MCRWQVVALWYCFERPIGFKQVRLAVIDADAAIFIGNLLLLVLLLSFTS